MNMQLLIHLHFTHRLYSKQKILLNNLTTMKSFYEGVIFCIAQKNAENRLYHTKDYHYKMAIKYACATQSILNLLAFSQARGEDSEDKRYFQEYGQQCRALTESQLQFILDSLEKFHVIESYNTWDTDIKCYRLPYRYSVPYKYSIPSVIICVLLFYLIPVFLLASLVPGGVFSFTVQYNLTHSNNN